MIKVTQVAEGRYEVEPTVPGAKLLSWVMDRDQLPKSIVLAMVTLRMDGVGVRSKGVGVMLADGMWELDDSCLKSTGV